MKKSIIGALLLTAVMAHAQEGRVGINTDQPKATLDIQPNATNLAGTTNEGIIAPKLTKQRVADITYSSPQDIKNAEGTLVYITETDYTPENSTNPTEKDKRVAKIDEKGYYFYNGTEWVKSGNNAEWVYDDTTKRINLKRSGQNTEFVNKVFYNTKNGNLIDTDSDTHYASWVDTFPTNVKDVNYNLLYRESQNITPMLDNIGNMNGKNLSSNYLNVNEKISSGKLLNPGTLTSTLNLSPDNINPTYWASSIQGSFVKKDKVNTNYGIGISGYTILLDGTVDGYATAGRFENYINTPNKQGNLMGMVSSVNTGEKTTSSVRAMLGVDTYIQFNNTTIDNTVEEKTALYHGWYHFKNKQPKLPILAGFYYEGVLTDNGGSLDRVDNHYGIYLNNVDRAKNNYAIYTNAGKVRFGDNVGIGVDTPTQKLEVAGKIKASNVIFTGIPTYADDTTAGAGGLVAGEMYKTSTGELRIKL